MKKFLFKFWPILFIFLVWFIFANPYFLKGKVPYASTYQVNFFAPWSHYEKNWGPVKNNAMPDVHTQIYPWKKFTIDTWKSGQIPSWNPYNFTGNPHLANVQSAVLSPFNFLFFILPFIDAWSILILLQPLLAGLFTYLFIRAVGVSKAGSVVSSIAFMFSGFIVAWMAYGTLAFAILYLPLALFAIEKYFDTQRKRFLLLLTLTIPLSFFSGHFQISLYFLIGIASYVFFKGLISKNISITFYLMLSTIFGLGISLSQLLPSIELYRHSVRSELFRVDEAIPFQYLITSFAPDFFGNPVTRNDWFGHYAEWSSFIGIVPLLLGIQAILNFKYQKKLKYIIFFTVLGITSLILAVNSPLSNLIVSLKIPVISTSALSRIIVLFSFALAALAGFGFDQLHKNSRGIKINILFMITALILSAIWIMILFTNAYPPEWLIVAKRNLVLPTALFIGGVFLVVFSKINKKFIILAACWLLLATAFDSLRFATKWMPFDPKGLVYQQVPVISAIKNNIGDGRIFGNIGDSVLSSYYGFSSIEGYDPLYIGRYGEFIRSASTGELVKGERSVVHLDKQAKYVDRVLDLLGVSLVFQPIADTNQGWAYPVWADKERYKIVYKDDKFELYKNNRAMPRASLFYSFEVAREPSQIIGRFYSDDFSFKKTLLVEEELGLTLKEGAGSAEIVQYTPNKITIRIQTTEPALLFLADNFYPGWKAKVNGKQGKIYRADYTFRAVVVPAGQSEVEFLYENWYL